MKNPYPAMSAEQEAALIRQLPGSQEAFRRLYRHYFPRVYGYVASRVDTVQEAEDLTANIFLKVVEGISGFEYRGPGAFAAWLFRIAYAEVQQGYRALYRQPMVPIEDVPELMSADAPPDDAFARNEDFAQLRRALAQLSPRRQEVISMRFFGELRNQEIATVLGVDERTVASHLCRGLDDLKEWYAREAAVHE